MFCDRLYRFGRLYLSYPLYRFGRLYLSYPLYRFDLLCPFDLFDRLFP